MQYYSAIKKNEILAYATTRMDPEGIMLSETSLTRKKILYFLTCGIKQNKTNNKTKLIDTENRLVVGRGRVGGVGETSEGGQRVQTSSIKSHDCDVQPSGHS